MFDEAWSSARKHGASRGVKEALAKASDTTYPREALAVYAERVDEFAEGGGDSAYAEAAKLVTRMSALQDAAAQAAYVAALKERISEAQFHEAARVRQVRGNRRSASTTPEFDGIRDGIRPGGRVKAS